MERPENAEPEVEEGAEPDAEESLEGEKEEDVVEERVHGKGRGWLWVLVLVLVAAVAVLGVRCGALRTQMQDLELALSDSQANAAVVASALVPVAEEDAMVAKARQMAGSHDAAAVSLARASEIAGLIKRLAPEEPPAGLDRVTKLIAEVDAALNPPGS